MKTLTWLFLAFVLACAALGVLIVFAIGASAQQLTVTVSYLYAASNGVDKVSRNVSHVVCLPNPADIPKAVIAAAYEALGSADTAPLLRRHSPAGFTNAIPERP